MNSSCLPQTNKFIITKLLAVSEPHVFVVERSPRLTAGQIICVGEHELSGFLCGAGVDALGIQRVLHELEGGNRAEAETRKLSLRRKIQLPFSDHNLVT